MSMDDLQRDRLLIAEALADRIEEVQTEEEKRVLADMRYAYTCQHSKTQEYYCSAEIHFTQQSERPCIAVDTCLLPELVDLIKRQGVATVGSCCGHGKKQAYIQVAEHSVQKMLELGYTSLPADQYGNGKNCFVPKTYLRRYE